ncbi:MAG: carboxylesterase family protein, partial [Agathobacter sp.]|nr:carboxylesterase family protein [Agathobacter sp.]
MAKVFDYDNVPTVKVTGGQIKGYFYDGVHIFKGIPYARAKRFQMPVPVTPWDGVKRTAAYGYIAPLAGEIYLDDEIKVPHRHWVQNE